MSEFLVFRRKDSDPSFEWEAAGNFESLKDTELYAKKCQDWGFRVRIYRELTLPST